MIIVSCPLHKHADLWNPSPEQPAALFFSLKPPRINNRLKNLYLKKRFNILGVSSIIKLRMGLGRNTEDGDHYADMGIMIFVLERCNHGHSLACIICPWRPNTWEKVAWLQVRVSSMLVPLKRDAEGRWGEVSNGEQNRKRENKTNISGAYLQ